MPPIDLSSGGTGCECITALCTATLGKAALCAAVRWQGSVQVLLD